jgi:hypothetical protein
MPEEMSSASASGAFQSAPRGPIAAVDRAGHEMGKIAINFTVNAQSMGQEEVEMKALFDLRIGAVLVVFGLLAAAGVTPAAAGDLDGSTYAGMVGESGKAGDPDNFIFTNGTFRSTACDQYGYTEAPYTVAEDGGKTTFSATTINKGGATMAWHGTISGDTIEGTAVMTPKEGKPQTFWFKGDKKP